MTVEDLVRAKVAEVPAFGPGAEVGPIVRMASLTNQSFKVAVDGQDYVLRIAGQGTEEYIDRDVEEHAARVTAQAGVGAPLVYYDREGGLQVTAFIENGAPMDADVLSDPVALERAADAFRRLHTCGTPFLGRFDNFEKMDAYLDVLRRHDARLPEGYFEAKAEAEAVRQALVAADVTLAPCHNDPLPENLVYTGERVYLVDWEYAGNNDPMWDLADLSVETEFDEQQDAILLEAYCGGAPSKGMAARLVVYKAMAFLLWTLWGLLQEVNRNPAPAYHFASYWDYALDRFARCKAIMGREDFGALLEAIRRGNADRP